MNLILNFENLVQVENIFKRTASTVNVGTFWKDLNVFDETIKLYDDEIPKH